VNKEKAISKSKEKKTKRAQGASAAGITRGGISRGREEEDEQGRHEG